MYLTYNDGAEDEFGGQLAEVSLFFGLSCPTIEVFEPINLIHDLSEFVEASDVLTHPPAVAPATAIVVESSAPQLPAHNDPITPRRSCADAGGNAL